jgi:putative inorganic carbon (HCO3(-)) transporter
MSSAGELGQWKGGAPAGLRPGKGDDLAVGTILLTAVLFLIGVAGLLASDGVPAKKLALALAIVGGAPLAAAITGQAKRVFLFCWVVSVTYNRNYFPVIFGQHGPYGIYWNPSDVFLFYLLGLWFYEAAFLKRRPLAIGGRLWPWFLPFAVACALSALGAERPDYTAFEMVRVLRLALILVYVRFNVGEEEWWVCVGGFAAAVLIQSTLGAVHLVTGREFGLTTVFGVTGANSPAAYLMSGSAEEGVRRARGTLGHPNVLAAYLLLVGPLFLALAAVVRQRRVRWSCALVGIAALALLVGTGSRTSWVISIALLPPLVMGLVALRLVPLARGMGMLIVGALLGGLAILPLSGRVFGRLQEGFGTQVNYRLHSQRVAIDIWSRSPVVGVGLNNYSSQLVKLRSSKDEDVAIFEAVADYVLLSETRVTAWVHNIYLLFLAETGLWGLSGFLLFAAAGVLFCLRGLSGRDPTWVAASLGLLLGMTGLHIHGLQEAALWIEPISCTFVLIVALANNAVRLGGEGAAAAGAEPASISTGSGIGRGRLS